MCTLFLSSAIPAHADSSAISSFTNSALQTITFIALAATGLFFTYGGILYITSAGKPDLLEHAKTILRNAAIGIIVVIAASSFVSILKNSLVSPNTVSTTSTISISAITPTTPSNGLITVLIDAFEGFAKSLIESGLQPIVNSISTYLTTTPTPLTNSVINKFWLINLGIVDSLFVVVIALLGLHIISADTLGFGSINIKKLIPRIAIAFLGANISLYLANIVVETCNALVTTLLESNNGINGLLNTILTNPDKIFTGTLPLILIVFLLIFLVLAIVLLFLYISRLILISLFAVLSPFVFLIWAVPKFSHFSENVIKIYIVTVFTTFIHVVIIQLASSFLSLPSDNNALISIAVSIGLFITLLKSPSLLMTLLFSGSHTSTVRSFGYKFSNLMSRLTIN